MKSIRLTALLFFIWIFTIISSAQPTTQNINQKDLDTFITQIMNEWKVPGLSIAIVKNDSIILLKGYGYRDVAKKLPFY